MRHLGQFNLCDTPHKLIEWINTLPDINTIDDNAIRVNGILVHYDADFVRIVVDDIVLSLDTEDVIDLHDVILDNVEIHYGIPVELIIRVNSKLLEIGSSSIYKDIIFHDKKPFALSCRPEFNFVKPSLHYRKLEKEFFELNGIEVPNYDPYHIY